MEELIVPEAMYGSIFTKEFLETVNCRWKDCPLQSCLLTTGPVIYRTPWKNIVNPIFVPTTETILHNYPKNSLLEKLTHCGPDAAAMTETMESSSSHESSNDTCSTVIEVALVECRESQGSNDPFACNSGSRIEIQSSKTQTEDESEANVNSRALPERLLCTDSVAEQPIWEPQTTSESAPVFFKKDASTPPLLEKNCTKTIVFSEDLGSPCKKERDSLYFETKRLFRKSYIEALQNPMDLGSSSDESIEEEESSEHATEEVESDSGTVQKKCENNILQLKGWPERMSSEEEAREAIMSENRPQGSAKLNVSQEMSPRGSKPSSRRSQSLDRTYKSSQTSEFKPGLSSEKTFSANSPQITNGHPVRTEDAHYEFAYTECKEDRVFSSDPRSFRTDFQDCFFSVNLAPVLPCLENKPLSAKTRDPDGYLPNQLLEVNQELLQSGVISLCGNRDRGGRAVIQVCTKNNTWLKELSRVDDLTQLLLYFYSIPRKNIQALGLLILVDARKSQSIQALFRALLALQDTIPHAVHSVLILVDKEYAFKPDKEAAFQCEVLTSLKALHRFIDCSQLTAEFEGTFSYNHNDWIYFRRKLESFIANCKEALVFLRCSVCSLSNIQAPSNSKEVYDLMNKHKALMRLVLEDELLVTLRLQGGTVLARLRKEESCNTEDYRDAVETITKLYNQVDEEVHRLVLLSNKSLQQLETLLAMKSFEEGCDQIKVWFEKEREKFIVPVDQEQLSLEQMKRKQEEFLVFSEKAAQHSQKGLQLIKENSSLKSEKSFQDFSRYLSGITIQIEKRRNELEKLAKLYEFYEKAHQWMVHCDEHLDKLSMEDNYSQSDVQCLQNYHQEASSVFSESFQKAIEVVVALGNKEELKQWNVLWVRCQQTRHHLEEVLSEVIKGPSKEEVREVDWRSTNKLGHKFGMPHNHFSSKEENTFDSELQHSSLPTTALLLNQESIIQNTDVFPPARPSVPQMLTPLLSRFQRTNHASKDLDSLSTCHSEPIQGSAAHHRKHPLKKIMKKTQSFELAQPKRNHGELHQHGYTGVYIRGLEVISNVAAEKRNAQRSNVKSPLVCRNRSLSSPSRIHHTEDKEERRGGSKMDHIMDEMITTEREYVKSLGYIIDSYFPEMERTDLPQDLRGKRGIIFGNLEKLYDFHCQYFLKELEHCRDLPLRVSSCFLRHEEQFGMYALYSKNKPQSDALLISHGNTFFKNKQKELSDKMNLASYLLKPIQRMSKYALLLKDLIKECSEAQEQELCALRAAEEMVKFQLRHGNDLLAMDAIRGCDVNLKEQGQLRCQDEFIVWSGRKKYLRHVFLFEDLILFSKTKKIDRGYDIYMYKQSFKTAEIGMTENVGESGLRFEIWFRRRRKSQDTYILQANSTETKTAWTNLIGKILWRQALRNRELRMQEMVSMGIGNKPFMDIKPSDSAISDRAIDYIMKGTGSRTRASIAVSSFDHCTPFKRPHSTISSSSTSSSSGQSSSSVLSSLNLHIHSVPSPVASLAPPFCPWSYDVRTCIEEDEPEQETGSQPSTITDSSESSQCTSGESTGGFSSYAQAGFSPFLPETFVDDGSSNTGSQPPSQSTSPVLSDRKPRSESGQHSFPADDLVQRI